MRLLGAVVGALVWPLLAWAEPRPLRIPTGRGRCSYRCADAGFERHGSAGRSQGGSAGHPDRLHDGPRRRVHGGLRPERGAVDFLEKPFRAPDLLACVQRGPARSQHSWRKHAERAAVERRVATLTSPERDVLQLVVTGMLNKQIARELGIAEKTVKIHRSHMTHKMDAGSVAELVAMARKLEPPGSRP